MKYKKNKYGAIKTTIDNISFASRREADRYNQLKMMARAGEITDLRLQPRFELVPKNKTFRAVHYVADFDYYNKNGEYVVEDAKGMKTAAYIIKKKLMFHVHKVEIQEV